MGALTRQGRLKLFAGLFVLLLVALAAAWRWTPLHEFADPPVIAHWLRVMASSAWLPVLIGAVYIVGSAFMFPNTVLCLATILALGGWEGFLYATGGSMLAAIVTYLAARQYGPERLKQMKIKAVDRISDALKRGGVISITTLRLLPLAPFPVVNIMAGVAHVRPVPYVLGTLFGLLPGNLLMTAFGRQLRRMILDPTPADLAGLAAVVVIGSLMTWWLHRLTRPARG
jgi:phospholipase D1/2